MLTHPLTHSLTHPSAYVWLESTYVHAPAPMSTADPVSNSSICLSVCLSVCLPICLSVCLSVCLSACPSVWLSVCLSGIDSHAPAPTSTGANSFTHSSVLRLSDFLLATNACRCLGFPNRHTRVYTDVISRSTPSRIHSLTHSLIHSLHSLTHSLSHSLTHTFCVYSNAFHDLFKFRRFLVDKTADLSNFHLELTPVALATDR